MREKCLMPLVAACRAVFHARFWGVRVLWHGHESCAGNAVAAPSDTVLPPVCNVLIARTLRPLLQKAANRVAKGGKSHAQRPSFTVQKGFIRSLGVLAFVAIGPRRGPIMLNRMCSEAELVVGMQSMISSSKRANVTLLFAPFGDGFVSFDLPQVPFPSVTPHAVKHSSPPSGTGLTPIRYTPKLRMSRSKDGLWQIRPAVSCFWLRCVRLANENKCLFCSHLFCFSLNMHYLCSGNKTCNH